LRTTCVRVAPLYRLQPQVSPTALSTETDQAASQCLVLVDKENVLHRTCQLTYMALVLLVLHVGALNPVDACMDSDSGDRVSSTEGDNLSTASVSECAEGAQVQTQAAEVALAQAKQRALDLVHNLCVGPSMSNSKLQALLDLPMFEGVDEAADQV
jgi:hypothetical protein